MKFHNSFLQSFRGVKGALIKIYMKYYSKIYILSDFICKYRSMDDLFLLPTKKQKVPSGFGFGQHVQHLARDCRVRWFEKWSVMGTSAQSEFFLSFAWLFSDVILSCGSVHLDLILVGDLSLGRYLTQKDRMGRGQGWHVLPQEVWCRILYQVKHNSLIKR